MFASMCKLNPAVMSVAETAMGSSLQQHSIQRCSQESCLSVNVAGDHLEGDYVVNQVYGG